MRQHGLELSRASMPIGQIAKNLQGTWKNEDEDNGGGETRNEKCANTKSTKSGHCSVGLELKQKKGGGRKDKRIKQMFLLSGFFWAIQGLGMMTVHACVPTYSATWHSSSFL